MSQPFTVISAHQVAVNVVQVAFTAVPDSIATSNFSVAGPVGTTVLAVAAGSDPLTVNVQVTPAFVKGGAYRITASGLVSNTVNLSAPYGASFYGVGFVLPEALNQGAGNDTAASILRSHLSAPYRGKRAWEALVAAIAASDELVNANSRAAFDQVFTCTASGEFLQKRCADFGVTLPPGVNMSDDMLRNITIRTTNSKLVAESLLEILEVFYGEDSTRAWIETKNVEPFALYDGITFDILVDERDPVRVTFYTDDFAVITAATALEVAGVLNRTFNNAGLSAYATTFTADDGKHVRIYSGALGLQGALRVQGGMAQDCFVFPESIPYTTVADFIAVHPGDYINVDGDEIWGTFQVKDMHFDYDAIAGYTSRVWIDLAATSSTTLALGDKATVSIASANWEIWHKDADTFRITYNG